MLAKPRTALAYLILLAAIVAPVAHADVITDWNQVASRTFNAANVGGNTRARAAAMVNAAMFEAVNAVEGRYSPIAVRLEPAPKASAIAAAAAAAHRVLVEAAPGQKAKLDEALAETAARVADADARAAGLALGERAGAGILADRLDDALTAPDTYRPHTTPGVWVPTAAPLFPEYARAKLWGAARNDAYRPGPPPALASAQYARDYNEVKSLGGRASTARTPAQTDAVRFWTQPNLATSFEQIARHFTVEKKLSFVGIGALLRAALHGRREHVHGRLGRQVHLQLLASGHRHPQRRPGRQRRHRARRVLDAAQRDADASGVPLAGRDDRGGAANRVRTAVRRERGPDHDRGHGHAHAQARIRRIADMAQEMNDVRVWGGVHFRTSLDVSTAMGRRIADDILAGYMKAEIVARRARRRSRPSGPCGGCRPRPCDR